jgi:protease-4
MSGIYDLFLARVAEGRSLPVERIAASAEGRIFGGRDGLTRGLVDEIGGLADAISRARSLANLSSDARVAVAEETSSWLQALGAEDDPPNSAVRAAGAAAFVGSSATRVIGPVARVAAELEPFVDSIMPIVDHERALCALPFALTVR